MFFSPRLFCVGAVVGVIRELCRGGGAAAPPAPAKLCGDSTGGSAAEGLKAYWL